MIRVHLAPIGSTIAGAAAVALLTAVTLHGRAFQPPVGGWLAALGYLLISNALLIRGLHRRRSARFGWANIVTAVRSTLVGAIAGVVVASFSTPIPIALLVGLVVPALVLDAVDGWVARHTGTASELGARFDMEVDAFLLLALSVYVAQTLGLWVLAIGMMRYAFVAAGLLLPWLRRQLPPRYWRKVVTAVQGIALTITATRLLPGIDIVLVVIALGLLAESFGRDAVWLTIRRTAAESVPKALPAQSSRRGS
ncbi:MAG: CDP-alcohol phosphatidyltransferase family protein [Microbacteriaceae bacterium]|nr:MAG: CDP-alcohol phosphatidyltransferase family protein [Microbacteriaceae bacterium]